MVITAYMLVEVPGAYGKKGRSPAIDESLTQTSLGKVWLSRRQVGERNRNCTVSSYYINPLTDFRNYVRGFAERLDIGPVRVIFTS